ncbi:DNA-directed RNA polymerase subunit beta [Salipaludibacillus agaradhaerens]|jgi:type VI protein secretion system component VasF|uniref:DNA-directed RNA polymerase subunit beta n=1 Tax=Salipaludibacillus agaradhaerens TaxID=76935 RepID=UPI001FEC9E3F|nr:DNA-directed RNA polymerase subunit beta [Salipaludibacillus agaradhaerens]
MSEKNEHNKHSKQRTEDASKNVDLQPNTERTSAPRSWKKPREDEDNLLSPSENALKNNVMSQRSSSPRKNNNQSTENDVYGDVTNVHHSVYVASDAPTDMPPERERFIEQTNDFQEKHIEVDELNVDETEPTQKKTKKQKRREKKGRIRLIPIWVRLLIIVIAMVISLVLGAMVGYWLVGDGGAPTDVLKPETWYHIYDIIFDGTDRQRTQ